MNNDKEYNHKGRVYWITGMPGSGKTTLGTSLYYRLRETSDNVVILDGDILKKFVGDVVGYSYEDRLSRAYKYSNICKILSDQGIWVIICTVAMFDEVRKWNREYIDGYIEIYLDVPYDELARRNKKGLYSARGTTDNYVIREAEIPKDPDICVRYEEHHSVEDTLNDIGNINPRHISEFDRDRSYWNNIYERESVMLEPSDFARSVVEDMLKRGGAVLELGCGNGRDSLFFMDMGLNVTAIDASDKAIRQLREKRCTGRWICDDFVRCEALYQITFESIYSRFTLHAISERQEDELLKNIKGSLKPRGRVYIEARTINDELYGKGERVGVNAFVYNNHFRRFIDTAILKEKMERLGFTIVSASENKGYSKTNTSDPVLLRLIAEV